MKGLWLALCLTPSLVFAASGRACADSVADFYAAKKTVTLIIASGVGGG